MSRNYSADFKTQVEPCVFGGNPDCSQCGCSVSAAFHWISEHKLIGPLRAKHLLRASTVIGSAAARLQGVNLTSWKEREQARQKSAVNGTRNLVQISPKS
jgi:hypothetical protein